MNRSLLFAAGLAVFSLSGPAPAEAPFINPATDAAYFGSVQNILFWTPEQQVAGYRNMYGLPSIARDPGASK